MDEQLFIMLRRSASADGQWRGQANCDANLCSRIIKIAKIGPQRCSNGAREKMKLFMIGEPFHESDEGGSRRPLSAYGVVVLTEFSPCRRHQSGGSWACTTRLVAGLLIGARQSRQVGGGSSIADASSK